MSPFSNQQKKVSQKLTDIKSKCINKKNHSLKVVCKNTNKNQSGLRGSSIDDLSCSSHLISSAAETKLNNTVFSSVSQRFYSTTKPSE